MYGIVQIYFTYLDPKTGNMHDYIKGARLAGGSSLPPVDRLKISMCVWFDTLAE